MTTKQPGIIFFNMDHLENKLMNINKGEYFFESCFFYQLPLFSFCSPSCQNGGHVWGVFF